MSIATDRGLGKIQRRGNRIRRMGGSTERTLLGEPTGDIIPKALDSQESENGS
jgi:hypothetical protein